MHDRKPTDPEKEIVKLLAVVVLYKMKPGDSVALSTLQATISDLRPGQADVRILLYDNTPGGQDVGILPSDMRFQADHQNDGLAKAYNFASEMAQKDGFDWLLTLDQDTKLPIDFLQKLCSIAIFVAPMQDVAAIVPYMTSDGRVISPFTLMEYWMLTRHFPNGFFGIPLESVYAANSATTIKVSALKAIGGYDPRFYFYFADLVMNHRLHSNRLRILVAGNILVEHELSNFDLKNRTTLDRYEETCRAEEAAYDECMGSVAGMMLAIRILYRLVYRIWRLGGGVSHFKIGLRFLCRRLFYSRKHRMDSWNRFLRQRSVAQTFETRLLVKHSE
jgi:GT2 family glycosyltransferase